MRRQLLAVVLLSFGCQEYSIDRTNKPLREVDGYPRIAVEPEALSMGGHQVGCTPAVETLTISNIGDAPLEVADLRVDGARAWQVQGQVEVLDAGASVDVKVTFAPRDALVYDGSELVIVSNDPDMPELPVPLDGEGTPIGQAEAVFQQRDVEAVDVLWVIDNSGSMSDEVDDLSAELGVFLQGFTDLDLDWQIGVVTTDMEDPAHQGQLRGPVLGPQSPNPIGAFASQVAVGSGGSGDERGLDAAMAALSAPLVDGANQSFLRPEAALAVIAISDEDDNSDVSKQAFSSWLDTLKTDATGAPAPGMTTFSAIAGPDRTGLFAPGCPLFGSDSQASPAPKYAAATRLTGGVHVEICEIDFADVLGFLATVAAGLEQTFTLPAVPLDEATVEVEVDGVPTSQWYLDGADVVFADAHLPEPGAEIVVRYSVDGCP